MNMYCFYFERKSTFKICLCSMHSIYNKLPSHARQGVSLVDA